MNQSLMVAKGTRADVLHGIGGPATHFSPLTRLRDFVDMICIQEGPNRRTDPWDDGRGSRVK